MSEIVLVPGPLRRLVVQDSQVKLAPRLIPEPKSPERTATPAPSEPGRERKPRESTPNRGQRPPQEKPTPVIAAPDTGWPPIKVFTARVNRSALTNAASYRSWSELLGAVEGDPAKHQAQDGLLYARVVTGETFDLDRAKKVLDGLGDRRLVVSFGETGDAE